MGKRLMPGRLTKQLELRCVFCRELRSGPVGAPLPGRTTRSKECVCLPCAKRIAEWARIWRKHIDAWERSGELMMDTPSLPKRSAS